MNHVCFATDEGFDGCVTSCRNAAAVLGGSWAVILRNEALPPLVLESDLLVLSSWHPSYDVILEQRRRPTVLHWHSTILQSELGQEALKVAKAVGLLDRGAIPALAVSDPEFVSALQRDGVVCLPEVLDGGEYRDVVAAPLTGVNVSLFGAAHWRKNIFVQSAAFACAWRLAGGGPWTLHLNGQTDFEYGYDEWLQAARIPHVDHGWLDRPHYLSLVAAMDVGLSATLSESYCYVAADHVALGVPIVASPAVACLGAGAARTRPDTVEAVAADLADALANRSSVAARQRRGLDEQARANAAAARSALAEIAERARSCASG